jgi:hypothetical protein
LLGGLGLCRGLRCASWRNGTSLESIRAFHSRSGCAITVSFSLEVIFEKLVGELASEHGSGATWRSHRSPSE